MDSLRGNFHDADFDPQAYDTAEDDSDAFGEVPPSPVGQDDRRMQVRAYNFWASLLDNRHYPSIEDLDPQNLPDFGPHSVLLDFSTGIDNPAIPFLGESLRAECEGDGSIEQLDDVPSRSLLSRITDHYMQIIANQAPIGFEAEFVNQAGNTVLYRGILLPFSSDDDTIDFIYGVINWKELADQDTTDALMLEVDQSLERSLADAESDAEDDADGEEEKFPPAPDFDEEQVDGWADGPAAETSDAEYDTGSRIHVARFPLSVAPLPGEEDDPIDLPEPSFGLRRTVDMIKPPVIDPAAEGDFEEPLELGSYVASDDDEPEDLSVYAPDYGDTEEDELVEHESYGSLAGGYIGSDDEEEYDEDAGEEDFAPPIPEGYDGESMAAFVEAPEPPPVSGPELAPAPVANDIEHVGTAVGEPESSDMGLAEWLASARALAQQAKGSEERTRGALYDAIGRAYDFSLAAQENPGDFDDLVAEAGLTVQERAPMTPVVKLVFGADYDKTRVTEYAAALSHGHRLGVERGQMARLLSEAKGGLKAVVREERKLRRAEQGKQVDQSDGPRPAIARKLRALDSVALMDIDSEGAEFALVMLRREEDGTLSLLGEVPDDVALVERAARKLLG